MKSKIRLLSNKRNELPQPHTLFVLSSQQIAKTICLRAYAAIIFKGARFSKHNQRQTEQKKLMIKKLLFNFAQPRKQHLLYMVFPAAGYCSNELKYDARSV